MVTQSEDIEAILRENIKSTSAPSSSLPAEMFSKPPRNDSQTMEKEGVLFHHNRSRNRIIPLFTRMMVKDKKSPQTAQALPSPTASPIADATANGKPYSNNELGLSFQYPLHWYERGINQNELIISNEDGEYENFSKDGVQITISKQSDQFGLAITEYNSAKEYFEALARMKPENVLKVNNIPAVKETITFERSYKNNENDEDTFYSVVYSLLYNDSIYRLELYGPTIKSVKDNEITFDQILSTFRFLE